MRSNEFRAWDETNNVMHYDFQYIKSGADANDWVVFTSNLNTLTGHVHPFDNPYMQQQLKITQFIGTLDSKGVKIFEGDIVKCSQGVLGIVNYYHLKAQFGCEPVSGTELKFELWNELTVVGNIHETYLDC